MTQSEFTAAEEQFREIILLNPQRPTAYQGLGNALVKQGRYKEAETYLLEALRLQPDNKYVPSLLKQAREGQRRAAEATPELSTDNRH